MRSIKSLREARGISQERLADLLSVDRTTVTKWENSDICPRGKQLVALAEIFQCSIDRLFGRAGRE